MDALPIFKFAEHVLDFVPLAVSALRKAESFLSWQHFHRKTVGSMNY
jgi:hypothetical protein